jgi:hypothetical protein
MVIVVGVARPRGFSCFAEIRSEACVWMCVGDDAQLSESCRSRIYNLLLQPLGSELMWLDKGASRGEGFDCCSLASLSQRGTEDVPGNIDTVIARIRV